MVLYIHSSKAMCPFSDKKKVYIILYVYREVSNLNVTNKLFIYVFILVPPAVLTLSLYFVIYLTVWYTVSVCVFVRVCGCVREVYVRGMLTDIFNKDVFHKSLNIWSQLNVQVLLFCILIPTLLRPWGSAAAFHPSHEWPYGNYRQC